MNIKAIFIYTVYSIAPKMIFQINILKDIIDKIFSFI